jgi:hypothetical protein
MTRDEEVRAMEIATKLVENLLSWASTSSINAIGAAIVDLALQCDSVEDIQAVGDLLESLTERDRVAITRGERWARGSRALSQGEARKLLRGLSIDQMEAFAERWGYCLHEVIEWSLEQRDIHGGALVALGDVEEMAKITGGDDDDTR